MVDGSKDNAFQTEEDQYRYEIIETGTAHTRPTQMQMRLNPRTEKGK